MLSPSTALLAFALCCYGWGRGPHAAYFIAAARHCTLSASPSALSFSSSSAAFSMPRHWQRATSLAICAYAGIGLGALFLAANRPHDKLAAHLSPAPRFRSGSARLLSAASACFLIPNCCRATSSTIPTISSATWFGPCACWRPARWAATLIELLGQSDFGAQSFLQGDAAGWLPLNDAYAFDTIFCFLLGLCLSVRAGAPRPSPPALLTLAIAVYLAINPQIVNISSVYSTVRAHPRAFDGDDNSSRGLGTECSAGPARQLCHSC